MLFELVLCSSLCVVLAPLAAPPPPPPPQPLLSYIFVWRVCVVVLRQSCVCVVVLRQSWRVSDACVGVVVLRQPGRLGSRSKHFTRGVTTSESGRQS